MDGQDGRAEEGGSRGDGENECRKVEENNLHGTNFSLVMLMIRTINSVGMPLLSLPILT